MKGHGSEREMGNWHKRKQMLLADWLTLNHPLTWFVPFMFHMTLPAFQSQCRLLFLLCSSHSELSRAIVPGRPHHATYDQTLLDEFTPCLKWHKHVDCWHVFFLVFFFFFYLQHSALYSPSYFFFYYVGTVNPTCHGQLETSTLTKAVSLGEKLKPRRGSWTDETRGPAGYSGQCMTVSVYWKILHGIF